MSGERPLETSFPRYRGLVESNGIAFHEVPLTQENYRRVLEPLVGEAMWGGTLVVRPPEID